MLDMIVPVFYNMQCNTYVEQPRVVDPSYSSSLGFHVQYKFNFVKVIALSFHGLYKFNFIKVIALGFHALYKFNFSEVIAATIFL